MTYVNASMCILKGYTHLADTFIQHIINQQHEYVCRLYPMFHVSFGTKILLVE